MYTPESHPHSNDREASVLSIFLHSIQQKIESTVTSDSIDSHIQYAPSETWEGYVIFFDAMKVGYIDYTNHDDEKHPNGKFISINLFWTSNVHTRPSKKWDLEDYKPLRQLPENGKIDYLGHVLIASFIRTHGEWYSKIFLDAVGTKEYWRDSVGKFLVAQGLISKSHSQWMEVVYTLPVMPKKESIELEQKLARYGIQLPQTITNA